MSIRKVVSEDDVSSVATWDSPSFDADRKKSESAEIIKTVSAEELEAQKKRAVFGRGVVSTDDVSRIGLWDSPDFDDGAFSEASVRPKHDATTLYSREEFVTLEQNAKTFNKVNETEAFSRIGVWDLPIFGEDANGLPIEIQPDKVKMPTAEELAAVQETARAEAYNEGLAQGQADGFEQGKKEGYEAGLEEGRQQGKEEAYAEAKVEMDARVAEFSGLLNTLAQPLESLDREVEQQLVSLAMAVAKHVVRRELRTDPGQVVAAVREAVSLLPINTRNIRVYLHPEDATLIRESMQVGESEEEQRWKIVEDPALTRGGCNIETENSRIDATVETRLAAIIAQTLGGERDGDV